MSQIQFCGARSAFLFLPERQKGNEMPTSARTALWDKRASVQDEIEQFLATTAGRVLTPDEDSKADDLQGQINQIDASLKKHDELQASLANMPGQRPAITVGRDLGLDRPWGYDTFKCTAEEFIARQSTYHLPEGHALHPATRWQNAADGEFLRAVRNQRLGLANDPRLTYEAAAQGAGEFVGADGGFLLPKPSADRLVLRMSGGQVLSRVQRDVMTIGNSIDIKVINETDRATGSRHGAVRGYRLGEGDTITASRPKFANLGFKLHKYAALGYASDELLADVSLMGRVIFDAFGDELRFMAEDDIINGTGAGAPQGFLVATALVSVTKETGQAATTFVFPNALNMWARCYAPCRPNSVWFINQNVEPQLYQMSLAVGTGGVPVYLPPSGASGQPYATLFGRPVIPIEYAAGLGTKGDVILCDCSQYWFFDKGDPQQATSIHVAFTTDEQAFRVTYRADGRCSWIAPLTPYKGTGSTQSCCVVLDTRA